jgi:hypothetical protein
MDNLKIYLASTTHAGHNINHAIEVGQRLKEKNIHFLRIYTSPSACKNAQIVQKILSLNHPEVWNCLDSISQDPASPSYNRIILEKLSYFHPYGNILITTQRNFEKNLFSHIDDSIWSDEHANIYNGYVHVFANHPPPHSPMYSVW